MMDIVNHINELLFRYECVIIPGFGAFLTHHQSAYTDKDTNTFMPPSKTLSFNRQLQTNDGLLAAHLAKIYGLSYQEALQDLREQVQIWTEQLENKTPLHFVQLGVIESDQEGNWQFSPDPKNIFQAKSFGLGPVKRVEVNREGLSTPEQKVIPIQTEETRRNAASKYIRYAGAAVAIALVLGLGGFTWYKNDTQQYNLTQQRLAEQELEKQIHTASFTIANPLPAITLSFTKENRPYHIVAGAFREVENAEKRVAQLQNEGYTARILRENAYGLHEVVYNSFASKREAINELRKIVRTENENAWLLVMEDK
ncbi:MAG TPA: SPOR domain-containing protein [Flavobacteriaceae bacterium]|nr:SPOR domain-containing protein [Flavobacteriaceae bacterium]